MTAIRIEAWGRSKTGRERLNDEDAYVVADLAAGRRGLGPSVRSHVLGPAGSLFVVCDGLGGHSAGEVASQLAVETIYERLVGDRGRSVPIGQRLVPAVEEAGRRILAASRANPAHAGMATTVTAAALDDSTLWVAHVGDSRAYLVRDGTVAQITHDHSFAEEMVHEGVMTRSEARERFGKTLERAVGLHDDVQVDLIEVPLRTGDRLLLCTDGLSEELAPESLRAIASAERDPRRACNALVAAALAAGAMDDITAVVVRFDGDGLGTARPEEGQGVSR